MSLESNCKEKTAKHKYVEAKQMLLNKKWIIEEIQGNHKIPGNQ